MGIVGETFEDYGNAPECVINRIPAYEMLEGDLVRIYVCKTIAGRAVLDHTDVMTKSTLLAIGLRLLEIADAASKTLEGEAANIGLSRGH